MTSHQRKLVNVMDRKPSTAIKAPRYCGACPRRPMNKDLWKVLFDAAREAHGKEQLGLVSVKGDRAWFQVTGDPTPYSIVLSDAELAMFHL